MKAMILAAGLGTRLRPVTSTIPKAMVEVKGIPILEIIIRRMIHFGFDEVAINVHYHADKIIDFLNSKNNFDITIHISDESNEILDTGGGIKNAAPFLEGSEPFMVHNVDVLSDIDLRAFYEFHKHHNPIASLAVKDKNSSRSLLFDNSWELSGWKNSLTGVSRIIKNDQYDLRSIGFCGLHVINPEIFSIMKEKGIFSIITTYMNLASEYKILGYPVENNLWIDIGSHEQLKKVQSIDPKIYLK